MHVGNPDHLQIHTAELPSAAAAASARATTDTTIGHLYSEHAYSPGPDSPRLSQSITASSSPLSDKVDTVFQGQTALHTACESGDLTAIRSAISGSEINARNREGQTALFLAVKSGNAEAVQLLLAAGADARIPDNEGFPPIFEACANVKILQLFLDAKVDLNALQEQSTATVGAHALLRAITDGNEDVTRLLIARGVASHSPPHSSGDTFLHRASDHNKPAMARLLIEAGVSPNVSNSDGDTPLCAAQSSEMVQILATRENVNAANNRGETPLHRACENEQVEVAKALVRLGANLNCENKQHETPLELAREHSGFAEILEKETRVYSATNLEDKLALQLEHPVSQLKPYLEFIQEERDLLKAVETKLQARGIASSENYLFQELSSFDFLQETKEELKTRCRSLCAETFHILGVNPVHSQDRYREMTTQGVERGAQAIRDGASFRALQEILSEHRSHIATQLCQHTIHAFGEKRRYGRIDQTPLAGQYAPYAARVQEQLSSSSISPQTLRKWYPGCTVSCAGLRATVVEGRIKNRQIELTKFLMAEGPVSIIHNEKNTERLEKHFAEGPVFLHTDPLEVYSIFDHCSEIYDKMQASSSSDELLKLGAELHWWLAHAMPYQRGSAAVAEMTLQSIFDTKGFKIEWSSSADLAALTEPSLEAYVSAYPHFSVLTRK